MHKNALFLLKNCKKNFSLLEAPAPEPLASGDCGSFATRLPASDSWGIRPNHSPPLTNPNHTTDKSSRFLQPQITWNGIFLFLQITSIHHRKFCY